MDTKWQISHTKEFNNDSFQNKRGALKIFRLIWNQTEFCSVLEEEKLQRNHITLISKEIPKAFPCMNSTRA